MKLVFDIGYNHGDYTRSVISAYPEVDIVAVEGHPTFCTLFKLSPLNCVNLIEGVVSDVVSDKVSFFLSKESGNSFLWPDFKHHARITKKTAFIDEYFDLLQTVQDVISVKSVTLDHLINQYGMPDLIKLSIEGREHLAFRSLTHKVPLIAFEWLSRDREYVLECLSILKQLKYTQIACTDIQRTIQFELDYHPIDNTDIMQGDKGMLYVK